MADTVLELAKVSFSYGGEYALRDASICIGRGDFLGIIGPNGGGKTTLIRLGLGLLKPQSGTIRLLDGPPSATRHRVGYIPQETSSNRSFPISVQDVVLMGLAARRGIGRPFTHRDRELADSILERLALAPLRGKSIGQLSGGQRQKVLLARALVSSPAMLILDEPTSSLDASGTDEIYEHLHSLNAMGTTVVLVTHNVGVVSKYVKSIACVNKELHFHADGTLDEETITRTFGCPVDLIAHGIPHRVFHHHHEHQNNA